MSYSDLSFIQSQWIFILGFMINILKMRKLKLKKINDWPKVTQVIIAWAGIQTKHYLAPKFHPLIQMFPDLDSDKSLFIRLVNVEQLICQSLV